jgi:hypothetical protein
MSSLISVLTSPFNIAVKLLDVIKKYQKKRKVETLFISAFEHEIKTYVDIIEKICEIAEKNLYPILESVEDELSVHQMNEILAGSSDLPLMFAELIRAFINFANACKDVSVMKAFMDDLHETSGVLYDFVLIMKGAYVEEGKVQIGGAYYRFFQTYKTEISKNVNVRDLSEDVEKLRRYVKKIEHYVTKTAMIKRSIRKKYVKNFRVLMKEAENVVVKPSAVLELRAYIPEKLLPIAVLIEELSM